MKVRKTSMKIYTYEFLMLTDVHHFLSSRGYSAATQEGYLYILYNLDQYLAEHNQLDRDLTPIKVNAWLNANPQWGENHRYKAYNCMRSYIRFKFGGQHPVLQMTMKRPSPRPQRTLTRSSLDQLLESIPMETPVGVRNFAMVSLLVDTGIRKEELANLLLKDVDIDRRTLLVRIKGGSWASGVFSEVTADYLLDWLALRQEIARPNCVTFFCAVGGNTPGASLTGNGITVIFRDMGKKAGFRISPHDLRRTFASIMTAEGAPTELVRKAGRWSSDSMVKLYTQAVPVDAITPYLPMQRQADYAERKERPD